MKKMIAWLLLAALFLTGIALADGSTATDLTTTTDLSTSTNLSGSGKNEENLIPPVEGVITEILAPEYDEETEKLLSASLMLETEEYGLVEAHFHPETLLEGAEDLAVGDYVFITYNGIMSRSIPAQITAEKVTAYRFTGIVSQLQEDGFLLTTEDAGDVWVNAEAELLEGVAAEAEITVYFDGVMTMSLPGQICAAWIVPVAEEAAE